jgi:hypothetical protein
MQSYGIPVVVLGAVAGVSSLAANIGLVYAVYGDARARDGGDAGWWAVGSLFVPVAVWYWLRRGTYGSREYGPTTRERQARALIIGWGSAVILYALSSPPPDPITQLFFVGPVAIVGATVGYVVLDRRHRSNLDQG